jgi:antitoxin Phd
VDAKNKLSEVVDAAARGRPQVVTRRGVKTAVVISYDEYQRVMAAKEGRAPSLGTYLLAMPTGPELVEESGRIEVAPRDVTL